VNNTKDFNASYQDTCMKVTITDGEVVLDSITLHRTKIIIEGPLIITGKNISMVKVTIKQSSSTNSSLLKILIAVDAKIFSSCFVGLTFRDMRKASAIFFIIWTANISNVLFKQQF
jgi:hypothetical protein